MPSPALPLWLPDPGQLAILYKSQCSVKWAPSSEAVCQCRELMWVDTWHIGSHFLYHYHVSDLRACGAWPRTGEAGTHPSPGHGGSVGRMLGATPVTALGLSRRCGRLPSRLMDPVSESHSTEG